MEAKFTLIGETKDSVPVFVDIKSSHAATHLKENKALLALVQEALLTITSPINTEVFQVNFDRIVGDTDLLKTGADDEIIYAKRLNRDTYTRFVKHKRPVPTKSVVLILHKIKEGYELWSAWTGQTVPTFPGDEKEMPGSREFWSNHALVWGRQEVQAGTETTICPW